VEIAPSFLSADFGHLEREVRKVEEAGAKYIHLDVMDGHFVPNITFGPLVVAAIRRSTDLTLDVHLMIAHPEDYIQIFVDSGADILTVHTEVEDQLPHLVEMVRSAGARPGASIKPATSERILWPVLPDLDLVLVMSVEPGFGGQAFMPETLDKVRSLRAEIDRAGLRALIEIDGGIGPDTIRQAVEAGVEVLVAGSAVFRGGRVAENMSLLRAAAGVT